MKTAKELKHYVDTTDESLSDTYAVPFLIEIIARLEEKLDLHTREIEDIGHGLSETETEVFGDIQKRLDKLEGKKFCTCPTELGFDGESQ